MHLELKLKYIHMYMTYIINYLCNAYPGTRVHFHDLKKYVEHDCCHCHNGWSSNMMVCVTHTLHHIPCTWTHAIHSTKLKI